LYASKCTCTGIGLSGGCNTNCELQDNLSAGNVVSLPSPVCGTVQIDIGCKNGANTYGSVTFASKTASTSCMSTNPPGTNPPATTPPTAPPTTPGITASCQNIKAYSSTWTELTATQLTALRAGNTVNFCVTGVATGGSFNKAKFKINGVFQAETTMKRPGSEDFCQTYTIPANTARFYVSASINHVTLGWK
jgi:hypothetical protein